MDDLVEQALKNDLIERYDHAAVWKEGNGFRIVFELADGPPIGGWQRAIRYVDVDVNNGRIMLQSQKRQSFTVDYSFPDSMDRLDEFIVGCCLGKTKNIVWPQL